MVFKFSPTLNALSYGKNGYPLHSGKTMFLMRKNRPAEQTSLPFGHYEICLNPYPIFQRHLTIIDKEHTSQSIKGRFKNMLHLAENMIDFYILYNGPECGASALTTCTSSSRKRKVYLLPFSGFSERYNRTNRLRRCRLS